MKPFRFSNVLKQLHKPVIDNNEGTISVTFTFDELHAFNEHVDWVMYEQDQPVSKDLQSFIDKLLYNPRDTAPEIKKVDLPKEEWTD